MKDNTVRYGEYLKEIAVNHTQISYDDLTPKQDQASTKTIKLRSIDIYRLITPYVSVRLIDQTKALLPLSLYLALFQIIILRQPVSDSTIITFGLFAVIIGLMLFMEGIKLGLMPFGESIGNTLPKKVSLVYVLGVAFLLGIGVTFAEPAIGALKTAGSLLKVEEAPYLYALLNQYSNVLVLIVGVGVGFAAILGTIRFIYGWSLKIYIYITLVPIMLLTLYCMFDPNLAPVLGLAWDSGAVTTGPVTVPLVLSLGIGIASAAGKGDSSLSGFGIVTLASLFPIIGVMLLAIYLSFTISPEQIIQMAHDGLSLSIAKIPWYEQTPMVEIILGMRAILPLVVFLLIVMKVVLKQNIKNRGIVTYGITLSVIGMIIFNLGLTYGLAKLGSQSGGLIPVAFSEISNSNGDVIKALYPYGIGLSIAIAFAWILGFGATLAEPALNALGITVQNLTNGVFKKSTLMYAVSFGVGSGISLGVLKIIFDIPLGYLIIPLYLLSVILTYLSTEEFVNIAWDSAGVTTGPITVPLVLAMGLGFGDALDATDGFGILSMASIGPILAVLISGLWIRFKMKEIR